MRTPANKLRRVPGAIMISVDNDFEAFRDEFILYLAHKLGVSKDAALSLLGDWLIAFKAAAHPPALGERVEG